MHKLTCSLIALTCSLSLPAAVPLRWTVETSRVQPADFDAFHGEELALEAVLTSNGRPVNLDGKSARIYWQTNGMGSAYWSAPATAVSNRLAATFGPEMDPGGATVRGFIGMAGENYRAAFLLRLRGSPGPLPGYLPLPVPILDFDRVQVENAPYLTRSETENALVAATNAMPRGAARPLPKYLHALDFADSYADDAAWSYRQPRDYGGCSSIRDGNTYSRNFDFPFDHRAEFVVRMASGTGRLASVGVAQAGTNLTEGIVTSGKWSRWYKSLPGNTEDGINERGVVCNINVVGGAPAWHNTGDIHPLGAVRWVLDHATNATHAACHLAANVRFPEGWTQNFHYMVADESTTYIVENGEAHQVTNAPAVMTNFPLYPTRGAGEGQERYDALMGGASITSQWWTLTYTPSGYRPSDLPGIDAEGLAALWNYWGNNPRESHRGETFGGESWWQTVHTSIYNISNRTVRIAVQEQDDWYEFAVPSAGGVDADAVREIVRPMVDEATSNKADRTELAGYVPWANDEHNAVTIGTREEGSVIGEYSLARGYRVQATGYNSHAEGSSSRAEGDRSHAEGNGSHAEGDGSHAEGDGSHAEGDYSHAEGLASHAEGHFSHAEGDQSHAEGSASHAEGNRARTGDGTNGHTYAFAWQGVSTTAYYNSHGHGTFNVNPIGGLYGFWIAEQTLGGLFDDAATAANAYTLSSLTNTDVTAWSETSAPNSLVYLATHAQGELDPDAVRAIVDGSFANGTNAVNVALTNYVPRIRVDGPRTYFGNAEIDDDTTAGFAAGFSACVRGKQGIALGTGAEVGRFDDSPGDSEDSVAIGAFATVDTARDAVALGYSSAVSADKGIAVGGHASEYGAVTVGHAALSHGSYTVTVGPGDPDTASAGDPSMFWIGDTNFVDHVKNLTSDDIGRAVVSVMTNVTYVYDGTRTNRSDWAGNRERCVSVPPVHFGTGGAIVLEVDGNPEVGGKPVSGNYVYGGRSSNTFWFDRADGFMVYYDATPRHGNLDLEYDSTYLGTFAYAPTEVNVSTGGSLGSGSGNISLGGVTHALTWSHVRDIPGTSRWERVATGITREDADSIASNLANQIAAKQDALPYPTNAIPAAVITGADWLSGVDVNGERAPVTNGVAYVHVSGGGGTDGEAVTNIVRSLAYERDGANEIVSNRWTQTAERGVLPDYTAAGATVGSVGYDALLTYTTNGTLTLPADTRVRVLAVGGGGGGAGGGSYFGRTQTGGAGGGAGGMFETNVTLVAGTYSFSPGAGGAGGTVLNGGSSGGATTITFGGYTIFEVPGGGGGGNHAQPGAAGGCGGGAGGMNAGDVTCAASIGDPGRFGGAPGADGNGLVRLDWVESTVAGRQVVEIDSVTFDQTVATEITLRGMFTGTASGWQSPCGFSTEGGSLITRNPSNKFGNDKLGFNLDASKLATAPVTIVWTVGRIEGVNRQTVRIVYQDETEDTASATGTLMPGDIGRPLTLFGVGALTGGLYNFADFRLYSAVIRQDGVLKAELVPALAAGGAAGLYDDVSGRFLAPTSSVPLACSPYAVNLPGSGGGGMGAAGSGATTTAAGRGGDGIASDITGETVYYAGGGGGGSALSGVSAGTGGLGGGGSGVTYGTAPAQKAGLDGFGGGGGGGGVGATSLADGGAGGSGVVIVRIEHTDIVTNTVPYALMTDIPTAEEWQALMARLAEIEARLNAAGGAD